VHQRDVTGLDDLFDREVEASLHRPEWSQLLSQAVPALRDVAGLIQEDRFRVIDAQHRVEIACGHGVLEEVANDEQRIDVTAAGHLNPVWVMR